MGNDGPNQGQSDLRVAVDNIDIVDIDQFHVIFPQNIKHYCDIAEFMNLERAFLLLDLLLGEFFQEGDEDDPVAKVIEEVSDAFDIAFVGQLCVDPLCECLLLNTPTGEYLHHGDHWDKLR